MNISKSKELYNEAVKYIPGGVNSPARAFKAVGGDPLFISKGAGSKIYDADGNEYIDYVGSWGPHLFGHNPDFLVTALQNTLKDGTSFGAPTEIEVKMAKLITEMVPSVELVRMVNSGTEATMSAVRTARGYTGREKFIKFEGCYHGHGDYFLIKAGSGALTLGVPTSPGVTKGNAEDTLVADFNDIDSVKKLVESNKDEIAAIILEPVAGNMGVVPVEENFVKELRELCTKEGIVLIFDEVMSGFRLSKSGAQGINGITPDLSVFGKVIGGGLPVGAYGGKKEIMEKVSPAGPVYQAGTLSGNPLAMAAGYAMLKSINETDGLFEDLDKKTAALEDGINLSLDKLGLKYQINRVGSMISLFFTDKEVKSFKDASTSDTERFSRFFNEMLKNGVYLPCSQFESWFVSAAHSDDDINKTIEAVHKSLEAVK